MSWSKQLDTGQKDLIQSLLATMSVSEVAKALHVSRNTVYRWKTRQNTSRKSRRPKTNTASLLPVQRDVICELIRLSSWPKRELLPVMSRVFPVFEAVGEGGQRRLWKEIWGTGKLSPAQRNCDTPFYRSTFRVGALFIAQEGNALAPVCVLLAWESFSGVLVHRIAEGKTTDVSDFLLDLCHEWPFQIAKVTLVSTEHDVFPGLPGKQLESAPKVRCTVIGEKFQSLWRKLPPLGTETSARAGPQEKPPLLNFEVCANRAQIIWLPPRKGELDIDGVKRVARSWITSHNTRLRGHRTNWLPLSRQLLSPEEYLVRASMPKSGKPNPAVGDERPAETRAKLHLLLTQPLVMYSKTKRIGPSRQTTPVGKK